MTRLPLKSFVGQKNFATILIASCTFSLSQSRPVWAETQAAKPIATLTSAQLTTLARNPDVGARALSVTVVGNGPVVTVLAEEKETAGYKDLQIDAIFLAKALIEGAPGQIEKVKVLFSQSGKDSYITVTRGEINDYGSGKLTADALLHTLALIPVQAEKTPEVAAGPESDRRLLVWQRIESLRAHGTGVSPFENIFKEIEGLAKANEADKLSQRLTFLEAKLKGQEEQVKQARESLRGRGVPAVKAASNTSAGGAPQTGSGATPTPGASTGAQPPESTHLRAEYNSRGADIIEQVRRKNNDEGFKLRDMKTEIDKLFAGHEDAKAYALLHTFDTTAVRILGKQVFGPGAQGSGLNSSGSQGGPMGGGEGPGGFGPGGGTEGGPGGFGPPGGP